MVARSPETRKLPSESLAKTLQSQCKGEAFRWWNGLLPTKSQFDAIEAGLSLSLLHLEKTEAAGTSGHN